MACVSVWWLLSAIVSSLLTSGIFILVLRKFSGELVAGITEFVENLEQGFGAVVKRGYSLMGKAGGDSKAQSAIQNKLAKGFIDKNYGLIKIAADKIFGVDVDELIEEYGAVNIIQAIQQIAPQMGVDLSNLGDLNLSSLTSTVGATNERKRYKYQY